ncbi:Fimbrial protein [Enterobacter rongchengensis]
MKKINFKHALGSILFLIVLSVAQSAFAVEVVLTTEFKADMTKPTHNKFENTTPVSGFCSQFSTLCNEDEFSVVIPGFKAYKEFDVDSSDLSKHTFISLDGTSKSVTLVDVKNPANQITVQFRWSFFGVRHNRTNQADGDMFEAMMHTGLYPEGGCSGRTGIGTGQGAGYNHGWGVPDRMVSCYRLINKSSNFKGRVMIDNLSIGYTLTTPSPMQTRSGQYEGVVVYRVGDVVNTPGYIGLGADDYNGTDEIRVVIKATVEHAFKADFPAGSEQVKLAPRGGWSQWINGGRIPEQLQKEVPFILSSSSGFKMRMLCEHNQGQNCGLKNTQTAEIVPLEVLMSLPGFTADSGPVSRYPLTNISNGHTIHAPKEAIFNRRSSLDFQVKKPGVDKMVKEPGSTWRGLVTLIFDTEFE